jgi:hypothetical protein
MHGEFIAALCQHLPQADLSEWKPEGIIQFRNVCFLILPDQLGKQAFICVSIDLGAIPVGKRLSAYRHMVAFNLSKGGEEHGMLGFNPFSPDRAMHRVVFAKTDDLKPANFAKAIRALTSHALDFRAAYVEKTASDSANHSRFLMLRGAVQGGKHGK